MEGVHEVVEIVSYHEQEKQILDQQQHQVEKGTLVPGIAFFSLSHHPCAGDTGGIPNPPPPNSLLLRLTTAKVNRQKPHDEQGWRRRGLGLPPSSSMGSRWCKVGMEMARQ